MIDPSEIKGQPVLITGRALSNYVECAECIPEGYTIERCVLCSVRLVISGEASKLLEKARSLKSPVAGAICKMCLDTIPAHNSDVSISELGKQKTNTPEGAAWFAEIRKRFERK